jgi:hypothetical protein
MQPDGCFGRYALIHVLVYLLMDVSIDVRMDILKYLLMVALMAVCIDGLMVFLIHVLIFLFISKKK